MLVTCVLGTLDNTLPIPSTPQHDHGFGSIQGHKGHFKFNVGLLLGAHLEIPEVGHTFQKQNLNEAPHTYQPELNKFRESHKIQHNFGV